jgi:hypothetical protein
VARSALGVRDHRHPLAGRRLLQAGAERDLERVLHVVRLVSFGVAPLIGFVGFGRAAGARAARECGGRYRPLGSRAGSVVTPVKYGSISGFDARVSALACDPTAFATDRTMDW